MKILVAFALTSLALLAGCGATSSPARTAAEFDAQYEYGFFAGLPQRPTLMD